MINAADGETVEFVCEAKGRPSPAIKWIHNGKPIEDAPPNPRRRLVNGNKIILSDVVKTDTGNYGCNATNSLGYVYKDVYINVLSMALHCFTTCHILYHIVSQVYSSRNTASRKSGMYVTCCIICEMYFVAFPPEILEEPKDTVTIEGKLALLTCRVFGAPKPLVRWIRNDQELTGGRYKVLDNGDLEIRSVSFSDMGSYTCFAQNKFGNDSRTGKLVVKGILALF